MKRLNKYFAIFAALFFIGCGTAPSKDREVSVQQSIATNQQEIPRLLLIKDSQEIAPFYGLLESNPGGASTPIMYSGAAGLAGLLAQVLTHAAIANQAQNDALSKEQQASNLVLKNYDEYIKANTKQSFFANALSSVNVPTVQLGLIQPSKILDGMLIVDSLPVFYLSQDEGSIVIKHHIKVYYSHSPDELLFENMAKVISKPIVVSENNNIWLVGDGKLFSDTTHQLYNISLEFLIKDFYKFLDASESNKTHKYYIGGKKFYVRGALVLDDCNGKAIRNLKGNIVVVDFEKCSLNTANNI